MKGKFISFEGLDKSGKTTIIRELRKVHPEFKYHADPDYNALDGELREVILFSRKLNDEAELFGYLFARAILAERIKEELEQGYTVVCDRWADSTIVYQGYFRDWYSKIPRDVFNWMNRIAVLGTRPSPYEQLEKAEEKLEDLRSNKADKDEIQTLLESIDLLKIEIKKVEKSGEEFIGLVPDVTFFINTPPDICKKRLEVSAENKFDYEIRQHNHIKRLYEYYNYLVKQDKTNRFVKIDGEKSVREVLDEVLDTLIVRGVIK